MKKIILLLRSCLTANLIIITWRKAHGARPGGRNLLSLAADNFFGVRVYAQDYENDYLLCCLFLNKSFDCLFSMWM